MLKLFFLLISLTISLFPSNPIAFASLGNQIYNSAENIKKLIAISSFYPYKKRINNYLVKVKKAKQLGFSLDENTPAKTRKEYLITLRKLSDENNYYHRLAQKTLESSIKKEDSLLFSNIINSGLIDRKANKKRILHYYFAHKKEINPAGLIQSYLDEDAKRKHKRKGLRVKRVIKKSKEEDKIARLRARDKARKRALEERLERELQEKKKEIIEQQKEELLKSL
ncbi:hypothetical protein MNB_SM-5-612 [hydrothermal vent metagenome]|uniref:Uncharacterized protein n=1 Tax=hydrothermal vent metagenome TaxID=652676 RepID=A0A1W1CYU1_9ZZZZ